MSMNTEQERAEFEAWYRTHHGSRDMYERDASGEYADKQVQGAFNIWQAGQGALRAERDALRDVLDRIVSYYDMLRHNGRMPSMAYQAASDHENTMFGQARILLAKENT